MNKEKQKYSNDQTSYNQNKIYSQTDKVKIKAIHKPYLQIWVCSWVYFKI